MNLLLVILFISQCAWCTVVLQKQDLYHFQIEATLPHDTSSFTEGLFIRDGILYESTGLWGKSKLISRQLSSLEVLQSSSLPGNDFGEGIALVGNTITQLTYQSGNVYKYAKGNFGHRTVSQLPNRNIIKEGWGATTNGRDIIVSDGSSTLYVLDGHSMNIRSSIAVRYRGYPISNLNELELIGDYIFANIFMTDCAVKIRVISGEIVAWIRKGSGFYQTVNPGVDVMNGIAYDHSTKKLYVTGKNWPHMYSVNVSPDEATSNSDLDSFCVHRSMSLVDFSVMMTLMQPSTVSSSNAVPMPGLETTVSSSTSGPSADQIRDFFERHQSYFQLPVSPRSLVDVALDSPNDTPNNVASGTPETSSLLESKVDRVLQTQFLEDLTSDRNELLQIPMFPNALHPI